MLPRGCLDRSDQDAFPAVLPHHLAQMLFTGTVLAARACATSLALAPFPPISHN